MIDPKSLRIGNYVRNSDWIWSPDETNIIKEIYGAHVVTEIKSPSVTEFSASKRAEISHISGIPLSEQELIRLGFKGDSLFGTQTLYKLNNVEIWVFRNDNTFLLDNIKRKKVYLKYVHDVQSAFQLIEQTELTYKVENETIKP